MAESAHRRAQPGSDAGDDATTSEPSVVFVIGRARITSAARIAQHPDTNYHGMRGGPSARGPVETLRAPRTQLVTL